MKKLMLIFITVLMSSQIFSQTEYYVNSDNKNKSVSFYTIPNFSKGKNARQPPTSNKTYIDFVGTGDLQKVLSEGQELNANTGAGIIFQRYNNADKFFQSLEVEMSINIATTSDTIRGKVSNNTMTNNRDFGSYLLNPFSGKQAIFQNTNFYFGYPEGFAGRLFKFISGVNIRFVASNNVWELPSLANPDESKSYNLGAYMLRAGLFHEFIPDNFRVDSESKRVLYSLFLGLNYSMRGLAGDITAENNAAVRDQILGTTKKSFHGFEINMGFRLNNLRLEFNMPALGRIRQVPGLTNAQFLFTVRFVGGFGLAINTSSENLRN